MKIIAITVFVVACGAGQQDARISSVTKVGELVGTPIYPASFGANNWNPTGLSTATTIVATADGITNVTTGIAGGADGRRLDVCNNGLNTQSFGGTGSIAANSFSNGQTLDASGFTCMDLAYDGSGALWNNLSVTGDTIAVLQPLTVAGAVTASETTNAVGSVTAYVTTTSIAGVQSFRGAGTDEIVMNSSSGTLAAPTATPNTTKIGIYENLGYDGTSYVNGGQIDSVSAEAFTGIANGTTLEIETAPQGTTATAPSALIGPGNRASFISTTTAAATSSLQIGDTTGTANTSTFGGHIIASGNSVSFSSCGTSPACNSTVCSDFAGTFTTGSVTTTCTITFVASYGGADDAGCVIQALGVGTVPVFTTTATTLVASTILPSQKYAYICFGH